jgi:hypothetical protein
VLNLKILRKAETVPMDKLQSLPMFKCSDTCHKNSFVKKLRDAEKHSGITSVISVWVRNK